MGDIKTPKNRRADWKSGDSDLAQAVEDAVNLSTEETLDGVVGEVAGVRGIISFDSCATVGIIDTCVNPEDMIMEVGHDNTYIGGGFGGLWRRTSRSFVHSQHIAAGWSGIRTGTDTFWSESTLYTRSDRHTVSGKDSVKSA